MLRILAELIEGRTVAATINRMRILSERLPHSSAKKDFRGTCGNLLAPNSCLRRWMAVSSVASGLRPSSRSVLRALARPSGPPSFSNPSVSLCCRNQEASLEQAEAEYKSCMRMIPQRAKIVCLY